MGKYYGIDIGGTTVKIGLFSDTALLRRWEIPTDTSADGAHILEDIVRRLPEKADGAGLAVPGAALPDGTVNRCVNLGWGVCRPGEAFAAMTAIPCRVCNDASAAALGEQWRGAGAGFASVLFVALGTGVGAGVVIDGKLWPGAHGAAGELGHICVEPAETELCSCGNRGCLEQYCGAAGITRLCRCAGLGPLTPKELFARAAAGEQAALSAVDMVCDILGRGIAAACAVLDPEAVVLGGGVSAAGEALRGRTAAAFEKYAFHACRSTEIRLARLGGNAGIYGAARIAMDGGQAPGGLL